MRSFGSVALCAGLVGCGGPASLDVFLADAGGTYRVVDGVPESIGAASTIVGRWGGDQMVTISQAAPAVVTVYGRTGEVVAEHTSPELQPSWINHLTDTELVSTTASRTVQRVDLSTGAVTLEPDAVAVHAVSADGTQLLIEVESQTPGVSGLVLRTPAGDTPMTDVARWGNGCCGFAFTSDGTGLWMQAGVLADGEGFGRYDIASGGFESLGTVAPAGGSLEPYAVADRGDQLILGEVTGWYLIDRNTGAEQFLLTGSPPIGGAAGFSESLGWVLHAHYDDLMGATDYTVFDTGHPDAGNTYAGDALIEDSQAAYTSGVIFE